MCDSQEGYSLIFRALKISGIENCVSAQFFDFESNLFFWLLCF